MTTLNSKPKGFSDKFFEFGKYFIKKCKTTFENIAEYNDSLKIKKDDQVVVIAGKDKGREGKVIAVDPQKNKVLVEGVNMVTKHAKPSMTNQQGGIIHQEAFIDISNVMLLNKGQATRVGFKMDGDKKVRYAKKTGEVID